VFLSLRVSYLLEKEPSFSFSFPLLLFLGREMSKSNGDNVTKEKHSNAGPTRRMRRRKKKEERTGTFHENQKGAAPRGFFDF